MSPAASEAQMRAGRLEAKSRANWRYDRGAACCNNMPCASNGPSRVYTRALLLSLAIRGVPIALSPSITLPPFALPPYYSPLSTCKRRISTRSATDPRSHLLPRQLMDSGLLHSRYHLSKDSTILPGYNAVVDTTTMSGREREEREGLVYGRLWYTRGRR